MSSNMGFCLVLAGLRISLRVAKEAALGDAGDSWNSPRLLRFLKTCPKDDESSASLSLVLTLDDSSEEGSSEEEEEAWLSSPECFRFEQAMVNDLVLG